MFNRLIIALGVLALGCLSAPAQTVPNNVIPPAWAGASACNYQGPDAHAVLRTCQLKQQDIASLLDWVPAGTALGSTDISMYAQNAANDGCARSPAGIEIWVPAGTYIFHDIVNTCGNLWVGAATGSGGVGTANQTTTGAIIPGNTTVYYSAAASFFMEWQPMGFPAFKSSAHINGGGITGIMLQDGSSSTTALISEGTYDWKAWNIVINGGYNGVFMKGDEFPVTSHISMYATRNKNYEAVGDLSGLTASGAACSTSNGDCSTRNDAWFGDYLTNIDNLETNTVFTITGFTATTTLSHTNGEGPLNGMVVSCPNGLASNFSQCPAFGRMDDNQFENFHNYGVKLTDYSDFKFERLYSVGDGTTAALNAVYAASLNYTSTNIGSLVIENSKLFATGQDCGYFGGTQYGIAILTTDVYACNLQNNNFSALAFHNTTYNTLHDIKVIGNTLGQVTGYGGPFTLQYAVFLDYGVWDAVVADNFMNATGSLGAYGTWNGTSYTIGSPIYYGNSVPQLVRMKANIGPTPIPSVCGSGGGVTQGYKDSAFVFAPPSGVSTCLVTFGVIQPVAPVCTMSNYQTQPAGVTGVSTTGVTITANSGNLVDGYMVLCSTIDQ